MSDTASLRGPKPLVLADLVSTSLVQDALLVAGGAVFVGLLAQISFHIAGTPVPVTGQTLGVLVSDRSWSPRALSKTPCWSQAELSLWGCWRRSRSTSPALRCR